MLGIDFVGPLLITPKGNNMILTIADLFSKWTEAYPLPDKQATSVAAVLVNLFCNKGIPKAYQEARNASTNTQCLINDETYCVTYCYV